MVEVRQTETFARWLAGLRDDRARTRIQARIDRLELGNAGDVKPVGEGVSECGSITGLGTGCITFSAAWSSSSCSQAAIRARRTRTSQQRVNWRARSGDLDEQDQDDSVGFSGLSQDRSGHCVLP